MKLSCLQENLSKGLSIVGRAVATRATLPITNNVLISAEESRLKLVATNLEMAISHWIGAKVEEEGAITIPARLITEFVNSLPVGEKVDIKFKGKELTFKLVDTPGIATRIDYEDFLKYIYLASNLRPGIPGCLFPEAKSSPWSREKQPPYP